MLSSETPKRTRPDLRSGPRRFVPNAFDTYLNSYTFDKKSTALAELGNHASHVFLGDANMECAFLTSDATKRVVFIDEARQHWEGELSDSLFKGGDFITTDTEKAARQIAFLPLYNRLLLLDEMPPEDGKDTRRAYNNLLLIAGRLAKQELPTDREERQHIIGSANELSVALLLTRFVIHSDACGQYLVLPSLASQDRSRTIVNGAKHQWDLSVFTRYNQEDAIDLTYKIQIKSTKAQRRKDKYNYANDIAVVYVRDQLGVSKKQLEPYQIIRDCVAEVSDISEVRHSATKRLNKYTEKLLDRIDKPSN